MNLETFLNENHTSAFRQHVENANEAIFLATELLRKAGCVTENYYHRILKNLEKNGPYFVLVPGFAMPHAEPDCDVLRTGFSLVTLDPPVCFGHEENDPVSLVLCLACTDRREMNEEAMTGVMELLEDEERLNRLIRK